jgi:hypothetical protein
MDEAGGEGPPIRNRPMEAMYEQEWLDHGVARDNTLRSGL